ncbi:acyl-CoA thioesterase [Pedobacter boryungensis]|uniref:Acyl-CoA thioesterase n=1 Tax=Pedobacter boryungensis TaxID=869962 RepID=A0ABX2DA90_9SPHI|nr:thioesterase family protein [Pedobacter boryungensis]NQX30977.1 acyl-CoA thioesterase [Pedobacter boryungensis]
MFFKTFWRKKEIATDKKSVNLGHSDSFKYKTTIEMRFADLDMMGHVNNAVYFTYMEIGRTKYWNHAIKWDWQTTGVIIGQASIDYLAPLFLGDKITMQVRTSRIGTTSFDLEYLISKEINGKEIICSRGKTVCVAFDYNSKKPVAIPDKERNKMMEFEQLAG